MAFFDLPTPELERYQSSVREPFDFEAFWGETLAPEARQQPASFVSADNGLATIDTLDVTFPGFAGQPVRGWLHLPLTRSGPLPVVVEYLGYGVGRGRPHERTLWASAGYAHLVMDTRGQGTVTPDPEAADAVAGPGFLTRGLSGPGGHYYRRVFADAVRAVGAARSHPAVDGSAIVVTGTSQGGGIALAVAGLVPGLAAVMPDVPFLCDFPRAVALADSHPYTELGDFLARRREHAEAAMRTLSYIDAVCHARRATAPALFSVALMDHICPPSTVYAAFNAYPAMDKQISVYPYNGHEGGGADHEAVKLRWLAERLAA